MRMAIIGSRNFPQPHMVRNFVKELPEGTVIITGGARGVDLWAQLAAIARNLPVMIYPADWGQLGRKAGVMRNSLIVQDADEIVAFWDGHSRGTADVIAKAKAARKPLRVFQPTGTEVRKIL